MPKVRLTGDLAFCKANTGCYGLSPLLQRVLSWALLIQEEEIKPEGLRAQALCWGNLPLSSFTFHSIIKRTMRWPRWTQLPRTLPIVTLLQGWGWAVPTSIGLVRGAGAVETGRSISANVIASLPLSCLSTATIGVHFGVICEVYPHLGWLCFLAERNCYRYKIYYSFTSLRAHLALKSTWSLSETSRAM